MSLIAILLFFISSPLIAQNNYMAFLGGGGEPDGKTTIFDLEVENTSLFIANNKNRWNSEVYYNGGHAETEEILNTNLRGTGISNQHFTDKNFEKIIQRYEDLINSGKMKAGDQLLLKISTHGAIKDEKEISHQISTKSGAATNLLNLSGSKNVSLDRLKSLTELAHKKGVKLAILDFSCHSGSTLSLASPSTCIISSTGPNHFGWTDRYVATTFSTQYSLKMMAGKSLEEIFLETFNNRTSLDFPMISTKTGIELQNQLYNSITPYLHHFRKENKGNKLTPLLTEQVEKNQCLTEEINFRELIELSKQVEKTVRKNWAQLEVIEFSNFRKALEDYYLFQNNIREQIKNMNPPILKKMSTFCEMAKINLREFTSNQNRCNSWTDVEILSMNYEEYQKTLNKQKMSTDPFTRAFAIAEEKNLSKAKWRRKTLQEKYPSFNQYSEFLKNLTNQEETSLQLAQNVSIEFQKLYLHLYKKNPDFAKPNPCRDFVL